MDKIIIGLAAVALSIWAGVVWWWFLVDILKGFIVIALFFFGLLLIALGVKGTLKASEDKPATAKE